MFGVCLWYVSWSWFSDSTLMISPAQRPRTLHNWKATFSYIFWSFHHLSGPSTVKGGPGSKNGRCPDRHCGCCWYTDWFCDSGYSSSCSCSCSQSTTVPIHAAHCWCTTYLIISPTTCLNGRSIPQSWRLLFPVSSGFWRASEVVQKRLQDLASPSVCYGVRTEGGQIQDWWDCIIEGYFCSLVYSFRLVIFSLHCHSPPWTELNLLLT